MALGRNFTSCRCGIQCGRVLLRSHGNPTLTTMAMAFRLKPSGLSRQIFSTPITSKLPSRCAAPSRSYATSDRLPKIADASVWTSMIPRFIRDRKSRGTKKTKEWNPATFYIVMFTLIGSQAIRMLSLKNSYATYTRTTDAKIELLKGVIERIQSGEKVDVEKLLGTGDNAQEREWEEGVSWLFNPTRCSGI